LSVLYLIEIEEEEVAGVVKPQDKVIDMIFHWSQVAAKRDGPALPCVGGHSDGAARGNIELGAVAGSVVGVRAVHHVHAADGQGGRERRLPAQKGVQEAEFGLVRRRLVVAVDRDGLITALEEPVEEVNRIAQVDQAVPIDIAVGELGRDTRTRPIRSGGEALQEKGEC